MEETISLKEIGQVLKKRWLMIVSIAFSALLIAAIASYFILTPTYEASSQILVNAQTNQNNQNEFTQSDIQTNVKLINTYNVIIKSPTILESAISNMDTSMSTGELREKMQVASEQDSQVVTLTITDTNQERAAMMANSIVEVFKAEIPQLMNVDNVNILSPAEVQADPSQVSPKPFLNMAIALVVGLMVGVGLAFLLEYLDNTIKEEEDVEKQLGLPVMGIVTHMVDEDIKSGQQHQDAPAMPQQRRGRNSYAQEKKTV
ncbi:YveK family protein [Thalassobacillus sp. CUG 92003]|uniref:YveK family protein n=1 Tax=Thalassobacillus sp. CUG 92003 TaxID=2736641 RepID=UPI0015E790F7|nr:Wzz/FepE/Etk N-terminal domain-containing protein [Thalassobacillus sp. CUG 92003]